MPSNTNWFCILGEFAVNEWSTLCTVLCNIDKHVMFPRFFNANQDIREKESDIINSFRCESDAEHQTGNCTQNDAK